MIDWALLPEQRDEMHTRASEHTITIHNSLTNDVRRQLDIIASILYPIEQRTDTLNNAVNAAIDNIMDGIPVVLDENHTFAQRVQYRIQVGMRNVVRGLGAELLEHGAGILEHDPFEVNNPITNEPIVLTEDRMRTFRDTTAGITRRVIEIPRFAQRSDYWHNDDRTPTYRTNSEFFADYFSAMMRNDVEKIKILWHYFPEIMGVMENEIMPQIFERIGV